MKNGVDIKVVNNIPGGTTRMPTGKGKAAALAKKMLALKPNGKAIVSPFNQNSLSPLIHHARLFTGRCYRTTVRDGVTYIYETKD